VDLNEDVHPNHFSVCGTLRRGEEGLEQDFAIASLEKDIVVYIERLRMAHDYRIASRETGIVGHEYPLESNTRVLFGRFGRKEFVGLGNKQMIHELTTDWLNVGGHVGYVVCRQGERQNLMRYHDQTEGQGRVPKVQEWFSLVGEVDPASSLDGDDWACVVTFLNQSPEETADWAERVKFDVDDHVATCSFGSDVVRVDFGSRETVIVHEASVDVRK
jgi:hypothetical protein